MYNDVDLDLNPGDIVVLTYKREYGSDHSVVCVYLEKKTLQETPWQLPHPELFFLSKEGVISVVNYSDSHIQIKKLNDS